MQANVYNVHHASKKISNNNMWCIWQNFGAVQYIIIINIKNEWVFVLNATVNFFINFLLTISTKSHDQHIMEW